MNLDTTRLSTYGAPQHVEPSDTRRTEWVDRFLGSDPGLNRLRNSLMSVLTIALILEAELLFVRFTHALQIPTSGTRLSLPALASAAHANHEYLVIMMLIGAIVGMLGGMGVIDASAKGQLITLLFLPIPMIPTLILGIAVGDDRLLSLVLLAVILSVGTYFRRFGPRGVISGMLMFMGFFFGFFLNGLVTLGDAGWLSCAVGVGVVVSIIVRFSLFYPRHAEALERTQRSFDALAHKVTLLSLALLDSPATSDKARRQLRRSLVRLDEAGLMIDAQLANPSAVGKNISAQGLHQRLFDFELALTNVARFTEAISQLDIPIDQRVQVRLALQHIADRDEVGSKRHAELLMGLLPMTSAPGPDQDRTATVLAHRFAISITALASARAEWLVLGAEDGAKDNFQPSAILFGGWLPGSALVSAVASKEAGIAHGEQVRLAPYTRAAIQVGVAVGAAIALGDLLSPRRFYWAVIAAFITFMGVNNSGEQVRKGIFRILGTVIGICIGSLLVSAVGHHEYWSIVVILASLFFGFYLMRVNYAFMTIGITVTVSQMYVQLGEFSNSLLGERLAETAIGSTVAIIVVSTVLPLRTRRVLRVALRSHVQAIGVLVGHAGEHLMGRGHVGDTTLRSDARSLDATYQTLVATSQPLRRNLFGSFDEDTGQVVRLASGARDYARNLVSACACGELKEDLCGDIERAVSTLQASIEVLAAACTGPRDGTFTRSAALFDRVERCLEQNATTVDNGQLAIYDFMLLDGALAKLAEQLGLQVSDLDTMSRSDEITV
jgi:uncharacterized membrane protein YgaE (UPF0421/DUF939 family)